MESAYVHYGARFAQLRMRMETRRRTATAKSLVPSDAHSFCWDQLRYRRLRSRGMSRQLSDAGAQPQSAIIERLLQLRPHRFNLDPGAARSS